MKLTARAAQVLPQKVFSIDTLRMLQAGSTSTRSETERWLKRPALRLAQVLAQMHGAADALGSEPVGSRHGVLGGGQSDGPLDRPRKASIYKTPQPSPSR
jgi:hypothetical protein